MNSFDILQSFAKGKACDNTKHQKEEVPVILVYSLDRFSRTGDNAIFISSELKKQGVSIVP